MSESEAVSRDDLVSPWATPKGLIGHLEAIGIDEWLYEGHFDLLVAELTKTYGGKA